MIQFKDVTKKFGDRSVLNGISFSLEKGEICFVLGTSGTGKSVLLKCIVGLLRTTTGQIKIGDRDVTQLTEEEYLPVRKSCGMVFQQPALFDSLTIFENVAYGLRRHYPDWSEEQIRERVVEALQTVQMTGVEEKLPQAISYGMQKRVSLARTIAIKPEVLLFDEPTTGLDPVTTTVINKLIQDLSRKLKTTSIVVSHDMQCALAIADRIIVLDKGLIVATGTPSEMAHSKHPLVVDFLSEVMVQ